MSSSKNLWQSIERMLTKIENEVYVLEDKTLCLIAWQ